MNNCPRLIDADRLIHRLKNIERAITLSDGFYSGRKQLAGELVGEIDDGIYDPDPIPTINPGDWAIHPDLEQVRIMDAPVVHVLKGKDEYEVYLRDLEVISHD